MKILVVGGGGREHALAWKLAQSERVRKVYVAPGNGGTAGDPRMENIALDSPEDLAAFARDNDVSYTVVGPEAPLAAGVVDIFRNRGLAIFGPTRAAAQLESSKDFAKAFMLRHGIATAAYQSFTDAEAAHAHVDAHGAPIVIKADGLAAGKGVVVAHSVDEAHAAIRYMLGDAGLGQAGARVVIEECLDGEEISFIVMCDGEHVLPMASSQDHKRLLDGDKGPNTGGMGAYSPAPLVTPVLHERILAEIIHPTLDGMRKDGIPFSGFLYAGLMVGSGPDAERSLRLLEYNCRMGDPETQPILMRLQSDLAEIFAQAVQGRLDPRAARWDPRTALGVVVAAAGYPGTVRTGDAITGLPPESADCVCFHAGTQLEDGVLRTSGGRVLCVTTLGDSVAQTRDKAYAAIDRIQLDGMQFRRDIGWRALPSTHG